VHHLSIPACYFPSTVLFLDDGRDFLLNLVLQLDEGLAYRSFHSPEKALDYIRKKPGELELLQHRGLTAKKSSKPRLNETSAGDLAAIYKEVYNPHRFAEISVVIVDYILPVMDGLEFCRRIENNDIKKILLVGPADEALARAAVQEGIIHRYIKKTDANALSETTKSISDLQSQYFQEMSELIFQQLAIEAPSCLEDMAFSRFFSQFREDNRLFEYYLIDSSGSFLLLDEDANVSFFIIKTKDDVKLHHQFARLYHAAPDLLQKIAKGQKIPAGIQVSSMTISWEDWEKSLVSAELFIADRTYYYAHVRGAIFPELRHRKILSYHRYLEEIDAEELLIE